MEKGAAARQNAKMRVLTGAGTGAYAMDNSDKWLIHRHVATELDSRLAVVRQVPQQIVLAGADGDYTLLYEGEAVQGGLQDYFLAQA